MRLQDNGGRIYGKSEEIKKWTAWQLQDTYKSMKAMEDCELAWKLAIAGAYKGKEIPPWYMGTKLMRDE